MTAAIQRPLEVEIGRLRAAQAEWAARSMRERLAPARVLRRLIVAERDLLCSGLREVGKSAEEAIGAELLPLAAALEFLERRAAAILRPRKVPWRDRPFWLFGQSDTIHRRPRGIVGIIGTWNYPLFLNGVQIAQALTAGNAVLWKPSELAPCTARFLRELLERAGYPDDLMHTLPPTRENGQVVVEADIDHLVFTGSAEVGRRIGARLGERLVSSTLELSGIDAQFVLADADVELAARAAWFGATVNRGQTCIAVRRAFVHRSAYADFCERIGVQAARAEPVRLALPSQAQQAERLVRDAVNDGARLLHEHTVTPAESAAWQPTAVADARPEMAVCREASFAPLLAVLPFDRLDEAIAWERHSVFALGASVFTRDRVVAARIASQLRTGVVTVNDVVAPTAHPATPFHGTGASGWGVTQGAEGLLDLTVPQVVSVRSGRFRPHYDLAAGANGPSQEELVRGVLEASHSGRWIDRLGGWRRMLRAIWRGQ